MTAIPERIHIYPVIGRNRSDHQTGKSRACWCEPEYMQLCPEANPRGDCASTCYRCGGRGLIRYVNEDEKMVIVHRGGARRTNA